jgi:hypothetical protein
MEADNKQKIQLVYDRSKFDATELFQTLLDLSKDIGWDQALTLLEQCVIERRLSWWERNKDRLVLSGDPCLDAFEVFYKSYLGVSLPEEGEIFSKNEIRWITRWWNRCPTLEACQQLGLDTREVCLKVYERPVQALFERLHPGLRFRRNYAAIRPHAGYCEEIIELETNEF